MRMHYTHVCMYICALCSMWFCLCVNVHTSIHSCACSCKYHLNVSICANVCSHVRMQSCVYACMPVCAQLCTYVRMPVCIEVCIPNDYGLPWIDAFIDGNNRMSCDRHHSLYILTHLRMWYKAPSDAVYILSMHHRMHCIWEMVTGAIPLAWQEELTLSW